MGGGCSLPWSLCFCASEVFDSSLDGGISHKKLNLKNMYEIEYVNNTIPVKNYRYQIIRGTNIPRHTVPTYF